VLLSSEVWALICVISYIVRTVPKVLKGGKTFYLKHLVLMTVVEAIMWVSWIILSLVPQATMPLPLSIAILFGPFLFLIGITMFFEAKKELKGFRDPGKLLTTGIYGKVRHPMYLGWMLILLGFPLLFRALLAFIISIFLSAILVLWAYVEERELESKYGDELKAYRRKVGMFTPKL
jgi:protein-S-isoprenylcysteine O-methyltransferase Ste14